MPNLESFLPSDEWRSARVHWHAFAGFRECGSPARPIDRISWREREPDATLRTPWEVASWIDVQTRKYVHSRKVWASRDGAWVSIGDEDDLEHLRQENFAIASRGDSIHTDIYSESMDHDLHVEAVTDAQCTHGCATFS